MSRRQKAMLAIIAATAISIPVFLVVSAPAIEKMHNEHRGQTEFLGTEEVSENSQLIDELQQGVDILDKTVNEALTRVRYRRTVRLVPVFVTAYNPTVTQTDSTPQITASNKRVKPGIVGLSRDLEEEFGFQFGDTVVIEGIGRFVFEDRMNKRWTRRVDILMLSIKAAKEFGVQNSFLVVSD
jgi:3D (Asp-Asp-Asp) domain-containing protein